MGLIAYQAEAHVDGTLPVCGGAQPVGERVEYQ